MDSLVKSLDWAQSPVGPFGFGSFWVFLFLWVPFPVGQEN